MPTLPSWIRSLTRRPAYTASALWVLFLAGLLVPPGAAAQLQVVPDAKSRFWIHGDATVRTFTCVAKQVEGTAQLSVPTDSLPTEADDEQTEVVVRVPVEAVDCGNSVMTNDLQDALKMEQHPEIRFELVHATMQTSTDTSASWRRVDALGPLTVAGTKRLIRLDAAVRALDDDHFRIRGCLPIRMTYFNIDPPTKALGLIKVKNRVEVQYDLLAKTVSAGSSSPFDTLSLTNPPSCDD